MLFLCQMRLCYNEVRVYFYMHATSFLARFQPYSQLLVNIPSTKCDAGVFHAMASNTILNLAKNLVILQQCHNPYLQQFL